MEGGSPVSKKERHQLILSIIEQEVIDTQETLQRRLQQQDIQVTQATLSRDCLSISIHFHLNCIFRQSFSILRPKVP